MIHLNDYREIVGDKIISEIYKKARGLYGKSIIHLNSTYMGGGVAEILNSLVPLFNDIGIDAGWRVIHGNPDHTNLYPYMAGYRGFHERRSPEFLMEMLPAYPFTPSL